MALGFFDNLLGGGGQSGSGDDLPTFAEDMQNRRHSKTRRVLRVMYKPEQGIWSVEGRTGGFGIFDTKKEAVSKARSVYQSKDLYRGIRIENKDGGINTNRSIGDWQL